VVGVNAMAHDIDFDKPASNDDYCPMSELRFAYCGMKCCNDVAVDESFIAAMQD
jgi:hypothetical protein